MFMNKMLSNKPVQNGIIAQSKINDKSLAFFTKNVTKKLVETGKEEITIDSDRKMEIQTFKASKNSV